MSLLALLPAGLIGAIIFAGCYAAYSYALWKIAERCELRAPWLACIPIVQLYIMGAVADCYNLRVRGQKTRMGVTLLLLWFLPWAVGVIGTVVTTAFAAISAVVGLLLNIAGLLNLDFDALFSGAELSTEALIAILISLLLTLIVVSVIVLAAVFLYIVIPAVCGLCNTILTYVATYRIYSLHDRKNATMYLVIFVATSLLLPNPFGYIAEAVILWILHNKQPDFTPLGVAKPATSQAAPAATPAPTPAPVEAYSL